VDYRCEVDNFKVRHRQLTTQIISTTFFSLLWHTLYFTLQCTISCPSKATMSVRDQKRYLIVIKLNDVISACNI